MRKNKCDAITHTGKLCPYKSVLNGLCLQHFELEQNGRKVRRKSNEGI